MKLLIIIVLIILFFSSPYFYIKLKHKYWSNQPVSHYHLLLFLNPGIISNEIIPVVYTPGYDIESFKLTKYNIIDKWVKLLRKNYIPIVTPSLSYHISQKYLYWSIHSPNSLHYGVWSRDELVGTITSKEINIQLISTPLTIRYVDYLCVDHEHRSKNVASMLISHMASQYPGSCFIFKKEIYPLPYRHLVSFDTFMLSLNAIKTESSLSSLNIHQLSRKSTDKEILDCFVFYQNNCIKFKLFQRYSLKEFVYNFIYSDYVYSYYILDNNVIQSIIVLFDSQFTYEDKKVLELYLYLKNTSINSSLYLKHILSDLRDNNDYQYVYISDIGDNIEVLDNFENSKLDKYCNTTYIHLYNYHHEQLSKNEILLSFF